MQAILFLYRQVLEIELPWLENVTRAHKPKRLPVVLSIAEVFPADSLARHHLHERVVQRAVMAAVHKAGIVQPASCHAFRHCFATQLLVSACDIRTVQDLLGHADVRTTMIYTHVLGKGDGRQKPFG